MDRGLWAIWDEFAEANRVKYLALFFDGGTRTVCRAARNAPRLPSRITRRALCSNLFRASSHGATLSVGTACWLGKIKSARLAVLLGMVVNASFAVAQTYPAKPVRIIVDTSAGGPYDDAARGIGPKPTESWGQMVIVDNRAGAANIIGATAAAKSPPDGYTFFLANVASQAINPTLRKKLPCDPQKDFTPVSLMLSSPMVLVVHPSMPVNTVPDLIRVAAPKPGRLNYASSGVGNLQHLAMELLQALAKIKMNHIPYKGFAPASVDLVAGQVDLMFANVLGALPHVKSARVRAIAISSAKGSALLPGVPGVAATFPEFDVTTWMGLLAPTGTPHAIVSKVSADVNRVLQLPEMRERFAYQGADVLAGSPEQLADIARRDTARYAKVIREIGLSAE